MIQKGGPTTLRPPSYALLGEVHLTKQHLQCWLNCWKNTDFAPSWRPMRRLPEKPSARLETKGVRMVCISYLEVSGNPPHLRYTIRRLRQKLPGSSILVGLWPATDAALTDQGMRAQIGADYYARSLQEAVDLCIHANPKDEDLSASSPARGARM